MREYLVFSAKILTHPGSSYLGTTPLKRRKDCQNFQRAIYKVLRIPLHRRGAPKGRGGFFAAFWLGSPTPCTTMCENQRCCRVRVIVFSSRPPFMDNEIILTLPRSPVNCTNQLALLVSSFSPAAARVPIRMRGLPTKTSTSGPGSNMIRSETFGR